MVVITLDTMLRVDTHELDRRAHFLRKEMQDGPRRDAVEGKQLRNRAGLHGLLVMMEQGDVANVSDFESLLETSVGVAEANRFNARLEASDTVDFDEPEDRRTQWKYRTASSNN